ncbi:MAG: hypothetical protein K8T90_00845 [Planctomycetes bacterium]|nr:hypothetical protein [Planctomycetota bacterium]
MFWIASRWLTARDDEPAHSFYEMDDDRFEVRRVEVYQDGSRRRYTARGLHELEPIEVMPIPSLEEINSQPDFEARTTSAEEFESEWTQGST